MKGIAIGLADLVFGLAAYCKKSLHLTAQLLLARIWPAKDCRSNTLLFEGTVLEKMQRAAHSLCRSFLASAASAKFSSFASAF